MDSKLGVYLCVFFIALASTNAQYNGKIIGSFPNIPNNNHGVYGDVYAVSQTTIRIIGFSYDGTAPDAVVWVGETGNSPSKNNGFAISSTIEEAMNNANFGDLNLPTGKSVSNLKWISIWCRRYSINFNHVVVPANFAPPAEHNLGQLTGSNGLFASSVVIVNDQKIKFEGLQYDGSCSGAQFWAGTGSTPSSSGHIVPDENGSTAALGSYSEGDIELTLPNGESVFDIGYIGVWCQGADVGHVDIPAQLNIPPRPL